MRAVETFGQPPDDPLARTALAIGAEALVAAVRRDGHTDRLRAKLLRYEIRMATRPTPFGLFAGVGLVEWADRTDARLAHPVVRTRARPDMGWLLGLVDELERDPAIRRQLRFALNPLALIERDHVFLRETGREPPIPLPPDVQRALMLARRPTPYRDLAATLDDTPDTILDRLCERRVLLSDLRPPLTGVSPAQYVCEKLSDLPGAESIRSGLQALLDALGAWDRLDLGDERTAGWHELTEQCLAIHRPERAAPTLQVDAALRLERRRVHRAVAREAARAAELLLRLSPLPDGAHGLPGTLRQALSGGSRGPDPGAARPGSRSRSTRARPPNRPTRRALLRLAAQASRDGRHAVELDTASLGELETWRPDPATAPASLELCVSVLAGTREAIDRGAFSLIVSPSGGTELAGAHLARFADVVGDTRRWRWPDFRNSQTQSSWSTSPSTRERRTWRCARTSHRSRSCVARRRPIQNESSR